MPNPTSPTSENLSPARVFDFPVAKPWFRVDELELVGGGEVRFLTPTSAFLLAEAIQWCMFVAGGGKRTQAWPVAGVTCVVERNRVQLEGFGSAMTKREASALCERLLTAARTFGEKHA